jgi:ABC-type glutathione transport system ATPase component
MFDTIQKLTGKTRIMATHQLNLLHQFDRIIVMDKGRIIAVGPLQELLAKGIDLTLYLPTKGTKQREEDADQEKPEEKQGKASNAPKPSSGKLVDAEEHNTGSIAKETYKAYIQSAGGPLYFSLLIIICLLTQGARSISDWWLAYWSQEQEESPGLRSGTYYLSIFVGLSLISICKYLQFSIAKVISFTR